MGRIAECFYLRKNPRPQFYSPTNSGVSTGGPGVLGPSCGPKRGPAFGTLSKHG